MPLTSSIISIVRNKYLIAISAFTVIVLFLDHNNLFEQLERKQELKELQVKKQYYQNEIEKTKTELTDLSNNSIAIEKYARERYHMKKDNEDVFLIENINDSLKK